MTGPVELAWEGPLSQLPAEDRQALVGRRTTVSGQVRDQVAAMAREIDQRGDQALIDFTARFDDVDLEALQVPAKALEEAYQQAPTGFLEAFGTACDQVRAYHEAMVEPRSPVFERSGVTAYQRRVPIQRAGLYVPGGLAAYPSTVAMTVLPAQAAGVEEIVLASPPTGTGWPHPLVLAACRALGVEHVVPIGGAQAVLAMALGTESVPACQVVAGPGNAYVQAAKQQVAGTVRIDAPAGPSEVAVLVGPGADGSVAAREMIAQAEHAPDTLAVALCLDQEDAGSLVDALGAELEGLPREETVRQALARQGALLVADGLPEAVAFLDELAPEHCVLLHEDGQTIADRLRGPACVVAGARARVALTDYTAGPSHVLPTGGHARSYGGLSVETFTKPVHVALVDQPDVDLVEAATALARLEGLEGHARALEDRSP